MKENEASTSQQIYFKFGYNEGKHYTDAQNIWKKLTAKQQEELQRLQLYWDCTNYLAAAQIYLRDNFLLREPLQAEHIKDRLLGHWGTCPGINLAYAHLNYMLKKHEDLNLMFVLGPGHGNSAMLANVWISRELEEFYPKYDHTYQGLGNLIKGFSYPGGFPSHVNPQVPGAIHEGGELGYSLSVSYGAVLNQPDLMVACIVGDGESETGPTATAWHAHKFIDPKESGAVIPILHLNGYKISSATIPGAMSNEELISLYEGYGYQVRIVQNLEMIHVDMMDTMEWAYQQIKYIQHKARSGNPLFKPKWPMIIMKTPKGWTGIKNFHGEKIEGNYLAHQVPLKDCKTNMEALKAIEAWFRSYHLENLFNEDGTVNKYVMEACAPKHRGMGINKYTHRHKEKMEYPDIRKFAVKADVVARGNVMTSCTSEAGKYLAELYRFNPTAFKIFSPDELASNKLDYILKYTNRNFQAVEETANKGGGVIEMLSEHTLQGMLQGYLLTGRYGIFPSYEAFLPIVNSMMTQYAKFLKVCAEISWRYPVPSLNYIESSTLWRQEHNGFSHQNPSFINSIINMKSKYVRVYLPPDANCLISTVDHCMRSSNYINLVISSKNDTPNWLTMEEAIEHCRAGVSVWKWCSTDEGVNPDIVLVGIGNETTTEVVAASCILQHYVRKIRVRVVNITDLMILELDRKHPHGLTNEMFEAIFTKDKPVIINFHGYPSAVKQLIYGRKGLDRIHVNGYEEEGTTTTPFHMLTSNNVSRYDVAMQAVEYLTARGHSVAMDAPRIISDLKYILKLHSEYILEHGKDPEEIEGIKFIERWLHQKKRRGSNAQQQEQTGEQPQHDLEYPMSLAEEHRLIMSIQKESKKKEELSQKRTSFTHPHIQENVDRSAEQKLAM